MNIAARAGNWSAAHWKTATFGWLALVVAAIAIGSAARHVKLTDSEQGTGESARAQAILQRGGFSNHAGEGVLVQSRPRPRATRASCAELHAVLATLASQPQVRSIRSPLARGNGGQISKDGHSALIEFDMKGSADTRD